MDEPLKALTLDERRDLAPRARHLLAQQLAECGELLAPLLTNVLDDLEHELFRIGEQSSGGQPQHEAMEALKELRLQRPRFQGRLMALLERRFATIGAIGTTHDGSTPASGDLSLVDPKEFDESMALDDLSTRTELHAGNAVFDLCHRYAVLIAAPPLDSDTLPPGPRILAAVLAEVATESGLGRDQRLLFYRLCDRRLFGVAEAFYGRLNEHLKSSGILPDLRNYLPRQARPRARQADPGRTAESPGTAMDSGPAGYTDSGPIGPALNYTAPAPPPMRELHGLLEARRRAMNPEAAAAVAQHTAFASMPELQEALAALQAMPSRQADPHPGQRLTEDLMAELKRNAHGGDAPRLQPEHRDAVDLVGLLYDRLLTETRSEGVAQQLLSNLQVPLLRVALADSDFFTVRDHPARRLLNLVLETANLWLDLGGDRFDTALHQRLKRSVERVAADFQGDMGVISREADELETHLKLIARRAEIAERRQVEAAQGRDRLHDARATATRAIGERLEGKTIPPLPRALLENAWADALTLTLLREGENSDAYRRRLAVVDRLLEPSAGRDNDKLASELVHGLTQVGLQAGEADHIARSALDLPLRAGPQVATPPPSQTELLIHLKSRRKMGTTAATPTPTPTPTATAVTTDAGTTAGAAVATGAATTEPAPPPLTAAERRALEDLTRLSFGAWLEFTINQQGQTAARKLAWYNPASGNCLLVTAHGAAAPERTLDRIARLMARGQVRIMPSQDGGMIDRAWTALLAGLRKFGRTHPSTVPAT